MPRTRRKPAESQATEFQCPECGRTFLRAAALGAHRRRAHGVIGATALSRANRGSGSRTATARATDGRTGAARALSSGRSTAARRGRRGAAGQIDRDGLLQKVFPSGVPAREAVIRAANAWLDEAERLARLT
jgi:hypothetical protein